MADISITKNYNDKNEVCSATVVMKEILSLGECEWLLEQLTEVAGDPDVEGTTFTRIRMTKESEWKDLMRSQLEEILTCRQPQDLT